MNDNDFKFLNEVYKASLMGMDSINYLEDKIKDDKFKEEVDKQYNSYKLLSDNIENLINDNNSELDNTSVKDKVMLWASVQMNTMIDSTTSHLAEMLIQGTIMGVIEGVKISNQNSDLKKEVKDIINHFIITSENNIQSLKMYL